MSWLTDLSKRAENILTNLDEKTGAALKNHTIKPRKYIKNESISNTQNHISRSPIRRPVIVSDMRSDSPPQRIAPPSRYTSSSRPIEEIRQTPIKVKRSPTRKKNSSIYNLNHCPKTFIADGVINENEVILQDYGFRRRRFSLPEELERLFDKEFTNKVENLELENSVLKNELKIMNKEVTNLLNSLKKTEDDNAFTYDPDLEKASLQINNSNNNLNVENCVLNAQIHELKNKIDNLISLELPKLRENNQCLENSMEELKHDNKMLEDKIKQSETQYLAAKTKLENDLRQSQTSVDNLQNELEKSKEECQRLEKEWEAYKLRVKSMLNSKDKEIQAFQDGFQNSDVNNVLKEQLDTLRKEREMLLEGIDKTRNECSELRSCIEKLESKSQSSERLVTALREALREERNEKTKAESDFLLTKKELKRYQMETSEKLNNLETQLNEKESELNNIKDMSISTIDNSSLNVADYDVMATSLANDKIAYLTDTLVEKQTKIDSLLSERNMLRIHLDKLETKYKNEVSHRTNNHSVVNVNDVSDSRSRGRSNIPESVFKRISLRIGVFMKRNPLFRLLIIIYMVGLHLWVALVLLTYTPEEHPVGIAS